MKKVIVEKYSIIKFSNRSLKSAFLQANSSNDNEMELILEEMENPTHSSNGVKDLRKM